MKTINLAVITLLVILWSCNDSGKPAPSTESNRPHSEENSLAAVSSPEVEPAKSTGSPSSTTEMAGNRPLPEKNTETGTGPGIDMASPGLKQGSQSLQEFVFRNNHDTTIRLREGTGIVISANSFIYNDCQKPVKEPVTLQAREFCTIPEILLAGISTRTSDNILETGSMVCLDTKAGGRSCSLAPGKFIVLHFPFSGERKRMQLYEGYPDKSGKILWKPAGKGELGEVFTMTEVAPEYPGGDKAWFKFFSENCRYPEEALEQGIQGTVYLTFVVEADGSLSETRILRGIGGGCDEESLKVLSLTNNWIPGKQRGYPVRVQVTLPVKFLLAGTPGEKRPGITPTQVVIFPDSSCKRTYMKPVPESTYSYILRSDRLGWLNCDRLLQSGNPLITFSIEDDEQEMANMAMIFHRARVVLAPTCFHEGRFFFSGVPINEKVTIVSTRRREHKLFLATTDILISTVPGKKMTYAEVSEVQYRETIEKLNH